MSFLLRITHLANELIKRKVLESMNDVLASADGVNSLTQVRLIKFLLTTQRITILT